MPFTSGFGSVEPTKTRRTPASRIAIEQGGVKFVVRPGQNRNNRWFWGDPTTPLRSPSWAKTLKPLPPEGFYTLPESLELDGGGRWLKNAIVQLGYSGEGRGIIFVAEHRKSGATDALSIHGLEKVDDTGRLSIHHELIAIDVGHQR